MFHIIACQGMTADRNDRAAPGTRQEAAALGALLGTEPEIIGTPGVAVDAGWEEVLAGSRPTFDLLAETLLRVDTDQYMPVLVLNRCAAATATLPIHAARYPGLCVVWLDAHGDFNTPESSPTGYLGGMVIAAACGLWDSGCGEGVDPSRVVLGGVRDLDEAEAELISQHRVRVLPPSEITPELLKEAVGDWPVLIHIDWDVLQPGTIPTEYRVDRGLSPDHLSKLVEVLAPNAVAVELTEYESTTEEADARALETMVTILRPLFTQIAER